MPESPKGERSSPTVSKIKKLFGRGKHSSSANSSFTEDISMLSQSSTITNKKSRRSSLNINTSNSGVNGKRSTSKSKARLLSPVSLVGGNPENTRPSSTKTSLNLPNISPVRTSTSGRHGKGDVSEGELNDKLKNFHNPLKFLIPDNESSHLGTTELSAKVSRTVMDDYSDQDDEVDGEYSVHDDNSSLNLHSNSNNRSTDNGNTSNPEHHEENRGILSVIMNTLHFTSQTDIHEPQPLPAIEDNFDNADSINSEHIKLVHGNLNNFPELKTNGDATEDAGEELKSASPVEDVSFNPIKESLLNTFGKGSLSLDNFPKVDTKRLSTNSLDNSNPSNQLPKSSSQKTLTARFTSLTGDPIPEKFTNNITLGNSNLTGGKSSSNINGIISYSNFALGHNNKSESDLQKRSLPIVSSESQQAQLTTSFTNSERAINTEMPPSIKRSSMRHEGSPDYFSGEATNTSVDLNNGKAVGNDSELSFIQKRKRRNTADKSHNGISRILSRDTVLSTNDSPNENEEGDTNGAISANNGTSSIDFKKTERAMELYKKLGTKQQSDKQYELFHQCFPSIPRDELLLDVYVCAFRKKELLIQGKLFLSEKNIGFYSNIVSIVTSFILPFNKVLDIVKKKTIIFKNSIEFQTLHNKYFFASFLARDAAYDTICKMWSMHGSSAFSDTVKMTQEDDEVDDPTSDSDVDDDYEPNATTSKSMKRSTSVLSNAESKHRARRDTDIDAIDHSSEIHDDHGVSDDGYEEDDDDDVSISDEEQMVKEGGAAESSVTPTSFGDLPLVGPLIHGPTSNGYEALPIDTTVMDEIIPAPLGVVYNLLFGDDVSFIKNLLATQKNFNISEIPTLDEEKKRSFSYVKPLSGPVGPKQTRCNIVEQVTKCDFNSCVQALQTSDTPDVPKGNIFKIQTKIFLSWGKNNDTRLYVATCTIWSGSSFIKAAVEKGAIGGQKESIGVMVDELKKKIASSGGKLGAGSSKSVKTKGSRKRKSRKAHSEEGEQTTASSIQELSPPSHVEDKGTKGTIASLLSPINDLLPQPFTVQNVVFFILLIWFVHDKVLSTNYSSRNPGNTAYGNGPENGINNGFDDNRYLYNNHFLKNSGALVKSEYDVWEWINDRSGAVKGERKDAKVNSDILGKLKEQQILEMIDLLERRRDNLESMLGSREIDI